MALDPVAQRYAQTLFTDRIEELSRKHSTQMAALRAELASRGQLPTTTGYYYSEIARLGIEHASEVADARCDTLLAAYARANLQIDSQAVTDIGGEVEQVCEARRKHLAANMREQIGRAGLPSNLANQMAEILARGSSGIVARIYRRLSARRDEQILAARAAVPAEPSGAKKKGEDPNVLIRIWHASAKWQWFACLFVAAFIIVGVQEYLVALLILSVSALSLTSRLAHSDYQPKAKYLGIAGVLFTLIVLSYVIVDAKGSARWSRIHLPSLNSSHTSKLTTAPAVPALVTSDKTPLRDDPTVTQPPTSGHGPATAGADEPGSGQLKTPKSSKRTKTIGNLTQGAERPTKNESTDSPAAPTVQVNNAPNGIAIGGGTVTNPTVNNFSNPERHLTPEQKTQLESLVTSLPQSVATILTIEAENDPESSTYGDEIRAVFAAQSKVLGNSITLRLFEQPPVPKGVYVLISGEKDPSFKLAQEIANGLARAGASVSFEPGRDLRTGQIKIVVGYRP